MDLTSAITEIIYFMFSVYNVLRNGTFFTIYGYRVSFVDLLMVTIILTMIISLFWKGAKA